MRMRWHLPVQAATLQVRLHREHVVCSLPVQFVEFLKSLCTGKSSTNRRGGVLARRSEGFNCRAECSSSPPIPVRVSEPGEHYAANGLDLLSPRQCDMEALRSVHITIRSYDRSFSSSLLSFRLSRHLLEFTRGNTASHY